MSKKKPRSKDPHSWIKDTTKKGEESAPASEDDAPSESAAPAESADETAAGQEGQGRSPCPSA